jgi:hypothetical protein
VDLAVSAYRRRSLTQTMHIKKIEMQAVTFLNQFNPIFVVEQEGKGVSNLRLETLNFIGADRF